MELFVKPHPLNPPLFKRRWGREERRAPLLYRKTFPLPLMKGKGDKGG